ncbi:enoyl-CoA hydratase [Sagittula stellata E-37]|uniref:Enoyl-CoA hydratase n=1 Tax=Sagittula stellata (strain ATCC 700073 / DSM 11524 / E-37) TaxID=388399 RepID=A3K487_SAGS3|nr:enoyl-CoA hydratase [Sagittula stellata E-37]
MRAEGSALIETVANKAEARASWHFTAISAMR